jgi:putative aminopeptidase FrvX
MHTTVETVHESDVKEVIKLIYHTLQSIEYKQDFRYIK